MKSTSTEVEVVIFDFDGTATDAEVEGESYREGFILDLATLTGLSMDRVRALTAEFEAQVLADPDSYGWVYNGRIVAPATVDPYLRMAPVARMILADSGLQLPPEFVDRLLTGVLYRHNYAKTKTCFQPDARSTFNVVGAEKYTYIVTNSTPSKVQEKVRELARDTGGSLDWLVERVHGDAKKYVVHDDSIPGIEHSLELEGLRRPVLLQRPHYYHVLEEIRAKHGVTWDKVAVVGDIFELDLALPYALGCTIILVANEYTPIYERDFVTASPNGYVVSCLDEVRKLLV